MLLSVIALAAAIHGISVLGWMNTTGHAFTDFYQHFTFQLLVSSHWAPTVAVVGLVVTGSYAFRR